MKKVIWVLIFVFLPFFNSFAYKVDFQILNIGLKGICNNSNAVVIYGEFANILVSNDKGENWEQIALGEGITNTIEKIITFDETFWGIKDSSKLIKSFDGIKWFEYPIPTNYRFVGISVDTNLIYLLTSQMNKIFVLDTNFNLLDSLEISYPATEIFSSSKKLFVGTNQGKFYELQYNYKEWIINENDVSSMGTKVYNFQSDNGKFYLNIDSAFYRYEPQSNFVKLFEGNFGNVVVKDGKFYYANSIYLSQFNRPTKWIGFYRFDYNKNEFQKINGDEPSKFIEHYTKFLTGKVSFKFIDKNTIILISNYKTILISRDAGEHWELISYFLWANSWLQLNNYFWGILDKTIFRSSDYGVTWLPQDTNSLYSQYIGSINSIGFVFFDSSGKGLIANDMNYFYPDTTKNFSILVSSDFGKTYQRVYNKRIESLSRNNYYKGLVQLIRFKDGYILKGTNLRKKGDGITFANLSFLDSNFYWTGIDRRFEDTCLFRIFNFNDTLYGLFLVRDDSVEDSSFYLPVKSWVSYSTDGFNWNKLFDTEQDRFYINSKFYKVEFGGKKGMVYDNFAILDYTMKYQIFYIDLIKNKSSVLLNIETDLNGRIPPTLFGFFRNFVFCNLVTDTGNFVYELRDFDQPKWNITNIFDPLYLWGGTYGFYSSKDSIFCFSFRDSIYKGSYFAKGIYKETTYNKVEEDKNLLLGDIYIDVLPPYPHPAATFFTVRIYIERFNEIKPENFSIYDLSGSKVNKPFSVSIEKLSPFYYKANFDVSNFEEGLYIVVYKAPNVFASFPLIICK